MTFHEEILSQLLLYKEKNSEFRFIPRQRNIKEKLENGYWFQGRHDYAFVGLVNRSGGANMTRSVGLVFWPSGDHLEFSIEIVYKGEKDKDILSLYEILKSEIGELTEKDPQKFYKYIGDTSHGFDDVFNFLDVYYPKIVSIFANSNHQELIIDENNFTSLLSKINLYRDKLLNPTNKTINILLVNITWNSKDWKEVSEDASGHAWVGGENIPHESWNFDFDNPRNNDEEIFGFAKFTNSPKVEGDKNLIVFYSQGKIVGFYGKAQILKESEYVNDRESFNLIGNKKLSTVLKNKIENIKEKGYFENKERIGQIGFNYLEKTETALNVLNEAIKLNPDQFQVLTNIKEWIEENTNTQTNSNNNNMKSIVSTVPLNQILYGPPGTGKTFNSINEALKIVDPIFYQTNQYDRKKLTERFKELLIKDSDENKGQIAFCTFHQSFSYEDFVEGIKPKTTEEKAVYYDVEPGVFKRICQLADSNNSTIKVIKEGKISWSEEEFKKASFYKLSLGNYQNPMDRPIYEYCRDNNYIAIGFGQENDFTGLSESEVKEKCDQLKLEVTAAQQMNYFIHYLKKNNYIIVSSGNKYIRALGKVIGDYEYFPDSPIHYNHFRKVEWLFVDENIPIDEIYERGLSQKTMYKIDDSALRQDFFTDKGQQHVIENKIEKKYVLIIDEINRGNVSSIFGELITLIEEEKRAGKEEELEVILPYSKENFKVPSNIYIIGTMNTADRSVEALDAALRRRFCFEEMPPLYHLDELQNDIFGYKASEIVKTINLRIEKLLDKDHKIGHSYLLNKDENSIVDSFYKNIIPLLQEYFFGDYSKIGLILGKGFVSLKEFDKGSDIFADFDDVADDFDNRNVYEIIDYRKDEDYKLTLNKVEVIMDFEKAIQVLMNK